ncbi:hypothetical protein [Streptomyces sp. NPDC048272]|uniref:hypothetical protein n=1 Tax=Streptomyces sp. NPDC048272 TaxID=3154616 RepID=UPI003419D0FA
MTDTDYGYSDTAATLKPATNGAEVQNVAGTYGCDFRSNSPENPFVFSQGSHSLGEAAHSRISPSAENASALPHPGERSWPTHWPHRRLFQANGRHASVLEAAGHSEVLVNFRHLVTSCTVAK